MHEITIDDYKLFIMQYQEDSALSFAQTFAKRFNTDNPYLADMHNDAEAKEYIFNKYLVH